MYNRILVRYGDLTLKGKNQKYFVQAINQLIFDKCEDLNLTYELNHDRMYIILNGTPLEEIEKRLSYVTGLYSYSKVIKCAVDFEEIKSKSIELIQKIVPQTGITFKVDTKRADKNFPMTSMDFSRKLSVEVLRNVPHLIVDVKNPELVLQVEIRKDGAYLFSGQTKGVGGFPTPIAGKAAVMLSGGIDSPVAAYLAMKKGLEVDLVHFESTPLTPLESVQKAIDLAQVLARYAPKNKIRLHLIPFRPIHEEIIKHIPESYNITIMRRMMYRITSRVLTKNKLDAMITGDSLGQVASQTLESLHCIGEVTSKLILRPLTSYDKIDIIKIAKEIETLDISNRAFSDCCSVYIPKSPAIRPQSYLAKSYEKSFPYEEMIDEVMANIKTLVLTSTDHYDITLKGFSVEEAFQ